CALPIYGRLDGAQRGKHPHDGAGTLICLSRQQAGMPLRNMEYDCTGFEQNKITFLIGRDLAEGVEGEMRRPLHFAEGNKTHLIGLADLLKRPAYAHVARLPCTTVRRLPEGCNGGNHGFSPDYGLHNSRTIERSRRRQRRPERIALCPSAAWGSYDGIIALPNGRGYAPAISFSR